jgi:F0F1-type ATP synthase assembly protein I
MPPPDPSQTEQRKQLEARLEAAEAAQARKESGDSHRVMAQGYRFVGEVVGGVFLGAALGWLLGYLVEWTKPWGLIIGILGGAGLSIFVAVRNAARMQKEALEKAGPLPSVPDDEDEE